MIDGMTEDEIFLAGLQPRTLDDKVPVFQRRGARQGVVRDVVVGVQVAQFPDLQAKLVPSRPVVGVLNHVVQDRGGNVAKSGLQLQCGKCSCRSWKQAVLGMIMNVIQYTCMLQ